MKTIRLGSNEVSVEELRQLVEQAGREGLPEEGRKKLLAAVEYLEAVLEELGLGSVGELQALLSDFAAREQRRLSADRVKKD